VDINVLGQFAVAVLSNPNKNIYLEGKSYKSKIKKYQLLRISIGEVTNSVPAVSFSEFYSQLLS
jgi:hypothetical protein